MKERNIFIIHSFSIFLSATDQSQVSPSNAEL